MQSVEPEAYPLRGTRAQTMLENAMKVAQGAGQSQRDVAATLGYKSSVVLSHMTAGRVPIPIDRAKDIASALRMEANAFLLAVLEQRERVLRGALRLGLRIGRRRRPSRSPAPSAGGTRS